MEELTKEQRQIIEEEIKKEIKKADTFLKPESINKIIQDIIGNIKGNFKYPKNLEEILLSIPQKVYVSLGKEEIKQILKLDFCCFVDNVFYIDFAPKIEPYKHNQNKTAIEEQRIIQCSYDDLLYLFKTYPLIFNHCIFDYKIDKKTPIEQIKKLSFLNCNFKKEIYLHFQECLDIFQMDNCVFEDRVTIKGKFNDNVYFNNSIFKNYANFHTCEFEKTASFYGVRFEKTPNFSQAIFKGNLNAVNTNLNFTFDDLQERIKQEYKDFNKTKEEKPLDKIANDFRDSFRNFKNALIKDNNLLDASKFHKYELYCKEIELNSNDTLSKYERDEVFDKLSLYLKQKVDWCLLLFYRKLSDHHTDLLKILNNFFILIAVYYVYIITNTKFLEEKDIISSFLKSFSFYGDDKIVAVAKVLPLSYLLLLFASPIVIFFVSLYYTTKQKREIIFEKIKTKIQRCLLATSVFIVICLMLFVINSSFFIPLIKIVIFCGVFFLAIYINSLYLRYYFAILSYIVFSIVIVHYPIILNPLIGKILNDKIKIEDSLTLVITFAYTVLMFLVLFSLQKTARKNSIVPS
ncbi:pentapeptide repeat-containing protein [Campylobacter jejuni]|uniref:pentapeptide repeat-containing protein n=1 Tax=Campylobacter jejuni TaxID=197 RepID=UPI002B2303C8|nr:pentapeptide repeat-containing protein [Campylobacter jejuni]MEA8860221.1 pentapeptide repeat-containing protein [Campylobacter jejuni]